MNEKQKTEMGFLGAILIEPEALRRVRHLPAPADFTHDGCRLVHAAILRLWERAANIDAVSVASELGPDFRAVGGAAFLDRLLDSVGRDNDVEQLAQGIVGR